MFTYWQLFWCLVPRPGEPKHVGFLHLKPDGPAATLGLILIVLNEIHEEHTMLIVCANVCVLALSGSYLVHVPR